MTYVITDACIACEGHGKDGLHGACAPPCPVDCIHGPITPFNGDIKAQEEIKNLPNNGIGHQLYIDPDTCINCGAYLPECPEDAIVYDEDDDPEGYQRALKFFGQG